MAKATVRNSNTERSLVGRREENMHATGHRGRPSRQGRSPRSWPDEHERQEKGDPETDPAQREHPSIPRLPNGVGPLDAKRDAEEAEESHRGETNDHGDCSHES